MKQYTREEVANYMYSNFKQSEEGIVELALIMNCIPDTEKPSMDFIRRYQDLKRYFISYSIYKDKSHMDSVIMVLEDLNLIKELPNGLFTLSTTPSNTKGSWR